MTYATTVRVDHYARTVALIFAACTVAVGCTRPDSRQNPAEGLTDPPPTTQVKFGVRPVEKWTLRLDTYVGDRDWERSTVEEDVLLVHTRGGAVGINALAGVIMWRGEGSFVHPAGKLRPLYRVPDLSAPFVELRELVEVDPGDGTEVRRIPLEVPLKGMNVRVAVGDDTILVRLRANAQDELVAVDPATGAVRWTTSVTGHSDRPPVFLPGLIIVHPPYQAHSLDDGRALWSSQGACCQMCAPSPERAYIRTSDTGFTEIDPNDGQARRTLDGELLACDARYVVLDTGHSLRVLPHGGGAPSIDVSYKPGLRHVAVALSPSAIYYFDQELDKVIHHSIKDDHRTEIVALGKRLGISTERTEVLEPFLSVPPKVDGRRVYLLIGSAIRAFDMAPILQRKD